MDSHCPGLDDAPYLTQDIRAIPGAIKRKPEDFEVEEVPLYEPCGEGEHLFLRVEKRGISTFEALRRLGEAVRVPAEAFGRAGQKDAIAVATQHFTVSGVAEGAFTGLTLPGLKILGISRHRNKLRVGHLKGNRFRIRYSGAGPGALEKARRVLAVLAERGVPNAYMEQRFGRHRNTHLLGRAVLRKDAGSFVDLLLTFGEEDGPWAGKAARAIGSGDFSAGLDQVPHSLVSHRRALMALARGGTPDRALAAVPRRDKQLYLSAYQSYIFNKLLTLRFASLDALEAGDLAFLHRNGAVFKVTDPGAEAPRVRAFEISPSGPIFGHKVQLAGGRWGEEEASIAASEGFARGDWKVGSGLSQKGARRPFRFPLSDASVEGEGDDLIFRFFLPKGCYATAVFREIGKGEMKSGGPASPWIVD